MTSKDMKKVELFLHGVPILIALITACLPLLTNSMNPGSRGYCWLQDFPLHCSEDQNVECVRGKGFVIQKFVIDSLLVPELLLTGFTMWMIYATMRKLDTRNENSRKIRGRIVEYIIAYFLSFTPVLIYTTLRGAQSLDNILEILVMIFCPLWGFYNLIVFVLPSLRKVKEENINISHLRAFVTVVTSYGSPSLSDTRRRRGIPTRALQCDVERQKGLYFNTAADVESNEGLVEEV